MKDKIYGLQMLRFIAASCVVLDHALLLVMNPWQSNEALVRFFLSFGAIGVIVFFGISGFIMMLGRTDDFGSMRAASLFLISRIIRIVPLYFVATTGRFIDKFYSSPVYNFENYFKSLFFIPYHGEGNLFQPIVGQGWTLNYEMFFYLIFALSLIFPRKIGLAGCILILFCLGLGTGGPDAESVWTFYTAPLLLYFICGMCIALLVKRARFELSLSIKVGAGLALLISMMIFVHFTLMDSRTETAIMVVLVSLCVFICANIRMANRNAVARCIEYLGDASYSTYLFHGFILGIMKIIASRVAEGNISEAVAFGLLLIVLSNIGGCIVYTFVERPMVRFLNTRLVRHNINSRPDFSVRALPVRSA